VGFYFFEGPWENSRSPTIVMDDPNGGDYVILATISAVFRPNDLHEMCARANSGILNIDKMLAAIKKTRPE
jgi:hypothetical protein